MNKYLLLTGVLSILATATVTAQNLETPRLTSPISKGHITIGTGVGIGNMSAQNTSDGLDVYYQLTLKPSVGYMLTNHWLISAEVTSSVAGAFGGSHASFRAGGLGLSARYYFGKPDDSKGEINRFRFYAEAGGSYELRWMSANDISGPVRSTTQATVLKAGFGIDYLLNDNLAFETGLGGRRFIYHSENGSMTNMALQMELGVRVFLNRR